MNMISIKAKMAGYPVASFSVLISLAAIAFIYWRWDVEAALIVRRDTAHGELQAIVADENNAKNLVKDIDRAKLLYNKIIEKALDFDSTISAQGFFADFVQRSAVKTEGLPVQDALASLVPTAKPMAFCTYKLHATADFPALLKFVASFGEHTGRAMVVSRVQLTEADLSQKNDAVIGADIVFRLWGRKGDAVSSQPVSDKKVIPIAVRNSRLLAAEKCIAPNTVNLSTAINPFRANLVQAKENPELKLDSELEDALNRLKFSIEPFLGSNVVKIPGNSPKRVNNDLDVNVNGNLQKVRIITIEKDSFVVRTSTGNKIKISLKQ